MGKLKSHFLEGIRYEVQVVEDACRLTLVLRNHRAVLEGNLALSGEKLQALLTQRGVCEDQLKDDQVLTLSC